MYELRFGEKPPQRRSIEQLRGIEGARVRKTYQLLAQRHGVTWQGRRYDAQDWDKSDLANRCFSAANAYRRHYRSSRSRRGVCTRRRFHPHWKPLLCL